MNFNYFSREAYQKVVETAHIRTQYLYSIVVERKITDADIDSVFSGDDISIVILRDIVKKLYRELSREEQETLLVSAFNAIKYNEANAGEVESYFNRFADTYQMQDPQQILDETIESVGNIINYIIKSNLKRIENIPAELFKKCIMILFQEGINIEYVKGKILESIQKEEEARLQQLKNDPTRLAQLIIQAYQSGNMELVKKYSELLDQIQKEDNDGFQNPPNL